MNYKIKVSIPKAGVSSEKIIKCGSDAEAAHMAQNAAWDLYTKVEGSSYELPSYDDLFERYRSEWFDLSNSEFDQCLDDLYVRTIISNIDYSVEEV